MKDARSYRASRSDSHRAGGRDAYASARSPYLYGSAAPSFNAGESDFGVIPGKGARTEVVQLPSSVIAIARIAVIVAIVVAAIAFVRVGLSAMSINTSIATSELSSQIETARAAGNDLEVMQSRLSNSTHIKLEATSLGMAAPDEISVVSLSSDVVVTDGQGNLSLSGSLSAIGNVD